MEIALSTVRQMFNDILSGDLSREKANDWAYSMIQYDELGSLMYTPPSDKEKIWNGIMYLYGIDIMDSPDTYLHSTEDIAMAMRRKLGE